MSPFRLKKIRAAQIANCSRALATVAVAGAILLKEVVKHKMKFVAFLACTTLFLFLFVLSHAQDSNSATGYRAGHYAGTALNTTANQRGKVVFDLYDLNEKSGQVRAYFAASDGLEGEAWLNGRIDKNGELHLAGALAQFKMEVDGRLTSATTIQAKYSLVANTHQEGNFEVTLQRPLDSSPVNDSFDALVGAWEVGGGLPMQTNPITGVTSGISFVDVRRLEILPDGEFRHLHSHEHCEGTGLARCCLQTATMETGTLTVSDTQMLFRVNGGDNVARDNCQPRLNQQSKVTPKTENFSWTMRRDSGNRQQLCLQGGSNNGTTCYQRQS